MCLSNIEMTHVRILLLLGILLLTACDPSNDPPRPTSDCVTCHQDITPGIAKDWKLSTLNGKGVDCAMCHGTGHSSEDDAARTGVLENYAEAVRLYRSAAEQDYTSAHNNLALRYATGVDVPMDFIHGPCPVHIARRTGTQKRHREQGKDGHTHGPQGTGGGEEAERGTGQEGSAVGVDAAVHFAKIVTESNVKKWGFHSKGSTD